MWRRLRTHFSLSWRINAHQWSSSNIFLSFPCSNVGNPIEYSFEVNQFPLFQFLVQRNPCKRSLSLSLSLFSRVSFPSLPSLVPTCTIVFLRELSGRILLVLPSSPDVYVHEWCSEDFSYRHTAFPEIQPKNIAFFHVAPKRATIPTSTLIFSLFSNTLVIFSLELKIIVITILPLVFTIRLFL